MRRWSDLVAEMNARDHVYARMTPGEKVVSAEFWRRTWWWARRTVARGWEWVRCHTYNRYHVINVSGQDGYRWGWRDRDYILLLAAFKILRDFVEQEHPVVGLEPRADYVPDDQEDEGLDAQLEGDAEIRALYVWWTQERPARPRSLDWRSQEADDAEDQRMLHRLVEVRQRLWT